MTSSLTSEEPETKKVKKDEMEQITVQFQTESGEKNMAKTAGKWFYYLFII